MSDIWSLNQNDLKAKFAPLAAEMGDVYAVLGAYIRWIGEVEHQIDRNIAHLLGLTENFEIYGILANNLSHKSKVATLKSVLCQKIAPRRKKSHKIGSNLLARIGYFNDISLNMRNNLVHSTLLKRGDRLYFASTLRMKDTPRIKQRPSNLEPESVTLPDLMREVLWMADFHADLNELAKVTWERPYPETFEIDAPRSSLPSKAPL